jgi:hypothetical protein
VSRTTILLADDNSAILTHVSKMLEKEKNYQLPRPISCRRPDAAMVAETQSTQTNLRQRCYSTSVGAATVRTDGRRWLALTLSISRKVLV